MDGAQNKRSHTKSFQVSPALSVGTMDEEAGKDAAIEAEKQRLQMAAVLYRALRSAEDDLVNARPPTRAQLAEACHSKLQYDFPIVNAAELDALTEEMAAEIAEGTAPGSFTYPITSALVNAAVEGACKPAPGAGSAPGISGKSREADSDRDREDAGADGAGTEPAVDGGAVRIAYQRLCATTLVHFTSRVLAMPDDEAEVALRWFDGFDTEETAPDAGDGDGAPTDDEADARAPGEDDGREPPGSHAAANPPNDAADSDSDWEPMETDLTEDEHRARDPAQPAVPVPRLGAKLSVDAKLSHVLRRLSRACVDGDDVWRHSPHAALPQLAPALVSLTETLARSDGRPARRAMRRAPLRVLREHWAAIGPPPRSDGSIGRLLAALGFESSRHGGGNIGAVMERLGLDEDARGGDEDVGLALEFLAYLCVRLGGEALGDFASAAQSSAGKRAGFGVGAAGHLWGHVDAHIGVVAEKFDALAHVKATGDNSWQQRVGMCSLIVAFHAAKAPGNANPGDVLAKTGALRALCAAFTAPDNATAPHSEALRRAVLLVAAAAPKTVEFIAAVPGVRSEVESRDEFRGTEGSLAAHGAMWELLLPAPGTSREDAEHSCATRLAPLLDPRRGGGVGGGSSIALGLLRAAQTATRGATPLWRRGGAIDGVLRDALTHLAATVSAGARARGGVAGSSRPRKTTGSDDEGDDESRRGGDDSAAASDPEMEKSREMASAALRVLKEILGAADGGGGRKCD